MKKQIQYNGKDKFKKYVSEVINDDTDERRIDQLEETIKTLLSLLYGTEFWVDDEGKNITDSDNEDIVFLDENANGVLQRLNKLESEVIVFHE